MRSTVTGFLAVVLGAGTVGCVTTQIEASKPPLTTLAGVEISEDDLRRELQMLNQDSLEATLSSDEQLERAIASLYVRRRMVGLAEELGYLDREAVRAQLQRDYELRIALMVPQIYGEDVQVPDQAAKAREYYDAHLDEFKVQESVRVSYIFLRASNEADRARRRAEAEALLARAKASKDFGALAAEFSEDGSRLTLGDAGYIKRGTMSPAFDSAAFALSEPGQVSELVESPHGFYIIRLSGRIPAEVIPFDEVESRIIEKFANEFRREAVLAWRRVVTPLDVVSISDESLRKLLEELRAEFQAEPDAEVEGGDAATAQGLDAAQ